MNQTTMKIDRDVLTDLQELAELAHRTPQKQLRFLVDREKAKLQSANQTGQRARADIVKRVEASEALEGYAPLSEVGGYAYELQQQWMRGEIGSKEHGELLAKHYGYKYTE